MEKPLWLKFYLLFFVIWGSLWVDMAFSTFFWNWVWKLFMALGLAQSNPFIFFLFQLYYFMVVILLGVGTCITWCLRFMMGVGKIGPFFMFFWSFSIFNMKLFFVVSCSLVSCTQLFFFFFCLLLDMSILWLESGSLVLC